jgi:2-methylisocitrate lyase-like PEP mutase family enzyme
VAVVRAAAATSRKGRQVEAAVKDQRRLDSAVREEDVTVELGQMMPVPHSLALPRSLVAVPPQAQQQKANRFRALHDGDPFVIPNPWDAGSAKVLEALGFEALATTSSGFAFTLGRLDGNVTLDEVVEHTRAIDRATGLPVSVDLENSYGPDPRHAALAIERVAEAGAVGGSIEDYDPSGHLYALDHAAERIAAASEAARQLGFPFTLTARAENHIRGNPDLEDTIARLQAYEQAGADVLYAPGLGSGEQIRAVCDATSKPLNVLAHPHITMREIVEAGGQRVSVGGGLTWVAAGALAAAAERIRDSGDFSSLSVSIDLKRWLGG